MASYSKCQIIHKIVNDLIKRRFATVERGGKHLKLKFMNGATVPINGTPSDHRAALNFQRDVKRLLARGFGSTVGP